MVRGLAITATLAVIAALGTMVFMTTQTSDDEYVFAQCEASTVAGGSIGGPFELVNSAGETVTETDVITEPTIVYFGYTFCPDVCPLDTARNAEAIDLLAERGVSATPVFISIDPKRDTPEVVGDFAYNLHERMIGLTGSDEQVRAASEAYKTYYKVQPGDDDYYLVDHSTYSYLVLPEHGAVEFFVRDTTPEQMADVVQCYAEKM